MNRPTTPEDGDAIAAATATDRRTDELLDLADRVLAPTYARPRRMFTDGHGPWLLDADGEEFLDLSSGIAVLALGHRSEIVSAAIRDAADHLVHVSNLYHTAAPIELAARLVDLSFADSVFFANSGAEAVEGAIKFGRLAAGDDRDEIVYFEGSFHGRTFGALAATDRPDYQAPFRPLPEGFVRAPWNDPSGLGVIGRRTAAVLVEPIQGEMGVRVASADFLRGLRQRCDDAGALLVVDEIQCGLGRTGHLWAHEPAGIRPDMLTLAKPLAGGLPIGAVLMTAEVAGKLSPGVHGTTFGGGPLVTSVARKVLDRVADPEFLATVRARGDFLERALRRLLRHPSVLEVRGVGLMRGLRLDLPVKRVVEAAMDRHLLVVPSADSVIRILPPLDISEAALDQGVERLEAAILEVAEEVA